MNRRLLIPVALLVLAACSKAERAEDAMADSAAMVPAPAPAADAGVEKAAAVYRGVEAHPAAAESVLTAHGLTQAGFDSLVYAIAADSARAAAYAAATR